MGLFQGNSNAFSVYPLDGSNVFAAASIGEEDAASFFHTQDMGYVMEKVTGNRDLICHNGMRGDDKSTQSLSLQAEGNAAPFGLTCRFDQGQGEGGKTLKDGIFFFG